MKQRKDPSTKPYFRCLSCTRFRNECGGMPTRGMDLTEWCEYIRDVMEEKHLTSEYVSEAADVSLRTVTRIHAIDTNKDILRATARRIEQVVLGNVTQHICSIDHEARNAAEQIAALLAANEELRDEKRRQARIIDQLLDSK